MWECHRKPVRCHRQCWIWEERRHRTGRTKFYAKKTHRGTQMALRLTRAGQYTHPHEGSITIRGNVNGLWVYEAHQAYIYTINRLLRGIFKNPFLRFTPVAAFLLSFSSFCCAHLTATTSIRFRNSLASSLACCCMPKWSEHTEISLRRGSVSVIVVARATCKYIWY